MKLHTNTKEGKAGLFKNKTVYHMQAQIELSDVERQILNQHQEIGKMIVATGTFGASSPLEIECSVNMLGKGMDNCEFGSLALQTRFEAALQDGCRSLKEHFERLGQIGSGPATVEF